MNNERIKIGHGMVTWSGYERRSDRYGTIVFDTSQYGGSDTGGWDLDTDTIQAHLGTEGGSAGRADRDPAVRPCRGRLA